MADNVVVRFAPSPTGYLHVGGARTALFCWLMARSHNGRMILRIEDTDQKRNTPDAMRQVIRDLRWLGIDWDEGPEVEGPNGPYLQSQRRDIYDKYLKQLLDAGKAYHCFETPEELQAMREEARARKANLTYPRPEKFPDAADVENARSQGRPVTVRFAVPQDEPFVVNDVVRGQVTFAPTEIGDFIIQKSDGFPTYNFACVVDDELMKITHVIRGQEHLMNTPGQQALQDALGFRRPIYAHMSVTVSEGGGKLSKRERPKALRNAIKADPNIDLAKLADVAALTVEEIETFAKGKTTPDMPAVAAMAKHLGIELPEINVVDFFKSGYLPETMINFLALLGWSPGGDREIMAAEELIRRFDITRLVKANSFFDRQKLMAFNTEHIRMLDHDKLAQRFEDYLDAIESPVAGADSDLLRRIINACQGARTLADIEKKSRFIFIPNDRIQYDEKAVKKVLLKTGAIEILAIIRNKLAEMDDLTETNIETMLRSLAEEKHLGLGKVAQPLRVAICGNTISPPIFDSVSMLGKQNTLTRIDTAIQKFPAQEKPKGD